MSHQPAAQAAIDALNHLAEQHPDTPQQLAETLRALSNNDGPSVIASLLGVLHVLAAAVYDMPGLTRGQCDDVADTVEAAAARAASLREHYLEHAAARLTPAPELVGAR
jgi:hypothetical protein